MTTTRLEGKIVEFTETDWKQFPTFEDALKKWAEELLAEARANLEKENAELKKQLNKHPCVRKDYYCSDCLKDIEKAKKLIKKLKALYLYPVVTKDDVKRQDEILNEVEQFLNSGVSE